MGEGTTRGAATFWTLIATILLAASPAVGQTAALADRAFLGIDGGYHGLTRDFSDTVTVRLYAEEGRVESTYGVKPGRVFDAHGGVRLTGGLAIGAGVTRFNRTGSSHVVGSLPHPFFFSRHRTVAGVGSDLTREEIALHLQAMWVTSVNRSLTLVVFGGPSIFSVTQDLVDEVRFSEAYPFDTADFSGIREVRRRDRATGFNAGVDIGYFFSRHVGIGGLFRFSRATAELPTGDTDILSVDVGGAQGGAGLRLRF